MNLKIEQRLEEMGLTKHEKAKPLKVIRNMKFGGAIIEHPK